MISDNFMQLPEQSVLRQNLIKIKTIMMYPNNFTKMQTLGVRPRNLNDGIGKSL